jgi:hypothetical protein
MIIDKKQCDKTKYKYLSYLENTIVNKESLNILSMNGYCEQNHAILS